MREPPKAAHVENDILRMHTIRHDRSKEYGAFSAPKGRPRDHRHRGSGSCLPLSGARFWYLGER